MFLLQKILEEKIRHFLEEDLGQGDITTALLIPNGTLVEGEVVTKEEGIIAGIEEATTFLESQYLQVEILISDGSTVKEDMVVFDVSMRIPGSPLTRFTPHSGYLYGDSISYGERIAMEIKKAVKLNRLPELVT